MKPKILLCLTAGLLAIVVASTLASEISWSTKENSPDLLRQLVGLPSVAVGNLNPSARNPGLELLCTGMYDVPGGYCYYNAWGVPFAGFPMATNFTIIGNYSSESGK